MNSHDFLKRTPVRLAGAFAILFALTVVALVGVLYFALVSELDGAIRQHVEEISDALKAIDGQQGFEGLATVVAEEAKSVRDFDSIFLLREDNGSVRAGNVQNVRLFSGWGELDRAWLPMVANKGAKYARCNASFCMASAGHSPGPFFSQSARPCISPVARGRRSTCSLIPWLWSAAERSPSAYRSRLRTTISIMSPRRSMRRSRNCRR
jgi:hypothetical protein